MNENIEDLINDICEDLSPDASGVNRINIQTYQFKINGLIYNVEITDSIRLDTNEKFISVKFKLTNNPKSPDRDDYQNDRQYQIALQKSQIGITGTGNPQKVLRKVLYSIIDAVKTIKPKYITFNADETDRQRLYNKIINFVEKHVPFKYKKLNFHPFDGYELNGEEFWLEVIY